MSDPRVYTALVAAGMTVIAIMGIIAALAAGRMVWG